MSEPTQTAPDYKELMKDILVRLSDSIDTLEASVINVPHIKNMITTAQDYLFYLEDTSNN